MTLHLPKAAKVHPGVASEIFIDDRGNLWLTLLYPAPWGDQGSGSELTGSHFISHGHFKGENPCSLRD